MDHSALGNRRRLLLEQFIQRFELAYADNDLCTVWPGLVLKHERLAGQ